MRHGKLAASFEHFLLNPLGRLAPLPEKWAMVRQMSGNATYHGMADFLSLALRFMGAEGPAQNTKNKLFV